MGCALEFEETDKKTGRERGKTVSKRVRVDNYREPWVWGGEGAAVDGGEGRRL